MRTLLLSAVFLVTLLQVQQILAFSKYGRSCKDIGCLSSEVCVMAEDPCNYYSRDNCGSYPTCKPSGASTAPSCATFACPPTQICQLDNGTPKCVADRSSSTRVHHNENTNTGSSNTNTNSNPSYPSANPSYPAQNPSYPAQNPSYPAQNPSYPAQNPSYPAQNPSYPAQNPGYPGQTPGSSGYPSYPSQPSNSGGLYPSLTTSRPAQGGYPSQGGGYAGGAPGSGYPGGTPGSGYPGYPQQNNRGYPSQGGYPAYPNQNQGYPNQGYPQYPQGQGQYPGYPNQGYNGNNRGYQQPGYTNGNRYGGSAQGGSNPIVDKITDQLKTIGHKVNSYRKSSAHLDRRISFSLLISTIVLLVRNL